MSTLEEIGTKLDTVITLLQTPPAAPIVDLTPVLTAIADLSTEIKNNVEGTAPAPAPEAASVA